MMRRWGLWLIVAALCGVIAITFVLPHLMVAPGPLMPAHSRITTNCFACHAPFKGASATRCMACHKVADIGIRTTTGAPFRRDGDGIAFHQSLTKTDCMACHSDHSGPQLVRTSRQRFAHGLLRPKVRGKCATCHHAPQTPMHAQAGSNCAACHTLAGWKPATFEHNRYFTLTGPHNVSCTTCHIGGNTSRYTCFGCHQHQPDQIRASHAEEGIRNSENCVQCHRSASGESGEGHEGRGDD